jgi:hypothetical protein
MENVLAAFTPTRKRTTPISLLDDSSLEMLTVTVVSAKIRFRCLRATFKIWKLRIRIRVSGT